jgi:hypothetical protein
VKERYISLKQVSLVGMKWDQDIFLFYFLVFGSERHHEREREFSCWFLLKVWEIGRNFVVIYVIFWVQIAWSVRNWSKCFVIMRWWSYQITYVGFILWYFVSLGIMYFECTNRRVREHFVIDPHCINVAYLLLLYWHRIALVLPSYCSCIVIILLVY